MHCPVCKSSEYRKTELHAGDLNEALYDCAVCASVWSLNHGTIELVKDTQADSFLAGTTECVEGDDYNR